jgi:hypothetical protein
MNIPDLNQNNKIQFQDIFRKCKGRTISICLKIQMKFNKINKLTRDRKVVTKNFILE